MPAADHRPDNLKFGTGLVEPFTQLVTARPLLVLLLALGMVLGVSSFIPDFRLDASADSLVLDDDPDLRYYRDIIRRYGSDDFLIVTYRPHADLFSPEGLAGLRALEGELAQVEGVDSVLSLFDAPLLQSPVLPIEQLAREMPTLDTPGQDLELARIELRTSPIYKELVMSPDGRTTALLAYLPPTPDYERMVERRYQLRDALAAGTGDADTGAELQTLEVKFRNWQQAAAAKRDRLVEEVRALLDRHRGAATIYLGGVPMIAADMISFIRSDLMVFGSGVALLFLVTLALVFKRPRWVLMPLAAGALVGAFSLGFLGMVDWRVTVISSNFLALLLIISISLTIHLIVRYQELVSRRPELESRALVRETTAQMFIPCLYSALTTMVAFASLAVSGIKPVIDFGNMMVVGIFFAFVLVFLIMPAVMALQPRMADSRRRDLTTVLTGYLARFTEWAGGWVVVAAAVLGVLALAGGAMLKVENRFIDYFDEETEIHQGMLLIDRQLGGTAPMDLILEAPRAYLESQQAGPDDEEDLFGEAYAGDAGQDKPPGYWFNSVTVKRLEEVHDYLDSLPDVGKVLSLATGIKVAEILNKGVPLNDLELQLVRQLLPEDLKATLIKAYLGKDDNEARIAMRVLESRAGTRRNALLKEIDRGLREDLGFAPEEYRLTGMVVLYNNMLQSLFRSQILTLGLVFLIITGMFLVLFRSLALAAIAIVPNLLAAGIVLGVMGWTGIPLDMMTITIAAISIGMAVDNTIHYIYRFRREFALDHNYTQAMRRSHKTIGRAMYYTSLTIVIGFSVLSLSNFVPTVLFGLFSALALLMALFGALTLLPEMLRLFKPLGPEADGIADTDSPAQPGGEGP